MGYEDRANISPTDIEKVKRYKEKYDTDYCIIVSAKGITPKDSKSYRISIIGKRDNVLLIHPKIAVLVAELMRNVQANEISNVNKTLICSGQTAIDAEGKAAYPDDIGAQLKMALDNLEEVLRKADFSLSDIVRMTIYTTDMNKLVSAYEPTVVRLSHAKCRPAMTLLEVSRLAFSELMVEIEATAIQ